MINYCYKNNTELSAIKGGNSDLYDSVYDWKSLNENLGGEFKLDLTGIAPPSIPSLIEPDYSNLLEQNKFGMIWDKTPVIIDLKKLFQDLYRNSLIMV